jgi:hypothetical protein
MESQLSKNTLLSVVGIQKMDPKFWLPIAQKMQFNLFTIGKLPNGQVPYLKVQ